MFVSKNIWKIFLFIQVYVVFAIALILYNLHFKDITVKSRY